MFQLFVLIILYDAQIIAGKHQPFQVGSSVFFEEGTVFLLSSISFPKLILKLPTSDLESAIHQRNHYSLGGQEQGRLVFGSYNLSTKIEIIGEFAHHICSEACPLSLQYSKALVICTTEARTPMPFNPLFLIQVSIIYILLKTVDKVFLIKLQTSTIEAQYVSTVCN